MNLYLIFLFSLLSYKLEIRTISETVPERKIAGIRRHQSMYIHSPPSEFGNPGYKLHPVSGHSEIRPIMLQRSKTSIAASTTQGYREYLQAKYRDKSRYPNSSGSQDMLCEFQAGRSFDLPDIHKYSSNNNNNNANIRRNNWLGGSSTIGSTDKYTNSCMIDTYDQSDDSSRENIRYQAIDSLAVSDIQHRSSTNLRQVNICL